MNRILTFTTIAALSLTGAAQAQQTTQSGILGPSGNPTYPLRVQGANGVVYNCKDEVVQRDGAQARECIREGNDGGTVFGSGTAGIGTGGAVAGVVGIIVLGAIAGGSSSATTTN